MGHVTRQSVCSYNCPCTTYHERRKRFHFRGGGGGGRGVKHNIHCDVAVCAACMSINEVLRVKYLGMGGGGTLGSLAPLVPTPMLIMVK